MNGQFVTVFADASYCQHTDVAGWAVWIKHSTPAVTERLSGVVEGVPHSEAAEILALLEALKFLRSGAVPVAGAKVILQTDCLGAKGAIEADALTLREMGAVQVSVRWVKGHQGVKCARSAVNTWCDKAARRCMRQRRNEILAARNQTIAEVERR